MAEPNLAADLRAALADPTAWRRQARLNQLPPEGDWLTWLLLAGRGFGKTRAGAETICEWAEAGRYRQIALVGATAADVRDVMVEGPSGILTLARSLRPIYEPSRRRIAWPNGVVAHTYSADEPERLRGPQHDAAWADELAAWRYPEAWDQLLLGLRLGARPRVIVTTTPRPTRIIRALVDAPTTVVTRGSTFENAANLAPDFMRSVVGRYAGTRLGRQELDAELLDDTPGALWTRAILDETRAERAPELTRIVVAIDPATTSGDDADETGIVVAGRDARGHGYVLADLSCRASPDTWARIAVGAYRTWQADRIVGEVNQGGDMVELTIRTVDPNVPYRAVHASRGKRTRAEPIAALWEQQRCHLVGTFPALEDQLCAALPEGTDGLDDRLDALVWAFTELGLAGSTWEIPGAQAWVYHLWPCECGHQFVWTDGRKCPRCARPAPPSYPVTLEDMAEILSAREVAPDGS